MLDETIEPPDTARVAAAMDSLKKLGALAENEDLTSLGRVLLQLPIDASLGKLLLYGSMFRCLDTALTIAAILSNRSPFMSPPMLREKVHKIQNGFSPPAFRSDVLAAVMAFNRWREIESKSWDRACRFCEENMIRITSMLNIRQLRTALLSSLTDAGIIAVSAGGTVTRLSRHAKVIPPQLNTHNNSLPMMAALIALASAPNFAIRTANKSLRTFVDKVSEPGSIVNGLC